MASPAQAVDWARVREDFPILKRKVHGKPLVYLDSANTSQKPNQVIEAVDAFYREHNANVSRAVHQLSEEATALYEGARTGMAGFLGANHRDEIVLTSGTTMATNLVAYSYLLPRLKPGDAILVTAMEHHADIVPWQLVCKLIGAHLKVAPITESGELLVEKFVEALTPEVKFAGVVHVSNVLGTVNPVKQLARECRKRGIPLLVDGSQAAPHLPLDVKSIGCDFYCVTGHKMCGPTGTGALWARRELLDSMPPFFGGGEMIRTVSFDGTTFADSPHRFEAGTPNTAGFAGLGAAIDYLSGIGMDNIAAREHELLDYATPRLEAIPGLRIFGAAPDKAAVISFLIDGVHAHDLATLLDQEGVAVRSGHHCAHPLMQFYGVAATCRASLAFYNTEAEIDTLVEAIGRVRKLLA
ncbi:MAG TPA: cysteine desulfurase [Rhodanobacteraceae bacterium]|nr:cysteine desulfurase [Rhodanobacteraceae bacterium]